MKITIDGVEYVATPVGKDYMRKGARQIANRYHECPEFFDALLKRGFDYFEHDGDFDFDKWASNDGVVYFAPSSQDLSVRDEDERFFSMSQYPNIQGWNLAEFHENLQESPCIVQYNEASATAMLLKEGAARTVMELSGCGQLKEVCPDVNFMVTIK
jgi:hypothetical protein